MQHIQHDYDLSWFAPTILEGWLYGGRNYNLFAILGNVRNGVGFAGVVTGEGFNYISDSRGLPEDASDDVLNELGEDGGFYHSVSYVYLNELESFNWEQVTTKYGVVSEPQYQAWKETGRPSFYSGGVGGGGVVNITNEQMEAIIAGHVAREEGKTYYTRVQWQESYDEAVGGAFYPDAVNKLRELSTDPELDDVRIVFGFDS